MFKILKKVVLIAIILFLVYWGGSILRCEILTYRYGHELEHIEAIEKLYGPTWEMEGIKVLDYSEKYSEGFARVYHIARDNGPEEGGMGYLYILIKKNGEWTVSGGRCIWSEGGGNADKIIWPYIR